jgi:hypothetical protein
LRNAFSTAAEGKTPADFVASASVSEVALVQEEFFDEEPGETRLKMHFDLSSLMPGLRLVLRARAI